MENQYVLYGSYFFVSDIKVEHQRQVKTVIDILSEYGGFASAIFGLFAFIAIQINDRLFIGQMISILYGAKIMSQDLDDLAGHRDPKSQNKEEKKIANLDLEGGDHETSFSTFKQQSRPRAHIYKNQIKKGADKKEEKYGKDIHFSTLDKFSHLKYALKDSFCWFSRKKNVLENKRRLLKESEILYHEGYEAIVDRLDLINIVKKI